MFKQSDLTNLGISTPSIPSSSPWYQTTYDKINDMYSSNKPIKLKSTCFIEKRKILERLYKEGVISLDEMYILLLDSTQEIEL